MWKFIKWIFEQATAATNIYQLFSIPAVSIMLTSLAGYLGGVPLMWILMAASVTAAATAHFVLKYSQYMNLTTPSEKLEYVGIAHQVSCVWDEKGLPTHITSLHLGILLLNRAQFPMQFKVRSIRITVEGRAAAVERLEGKLQRVGPQIVVQTFPDAIKIGDLNTLEGKGLLELAVDYGVDNDLKYSIVRKQEFDFAIQLDKTVKPNAALGISVRDRD